MPEFFDNRRYNEKGEYVGGSACLPMPPSPQTSIEIKWTRPPLKVVLIGETVVLTPESEQSIDEFVGTIKEQVAKHVVASDVRLEERRKNLCEFSKLLDHASRHRNGPDANLALSAPIAIDGREAFLVIHFKQC